MRKGDGKPAVQDLSSAEEHYETITADVEIHQDGDDIVTARSGSWRDLYKTEDWWAIWIGFLVIAVTLVFKLAADMDLELFSFPTWGAGKATMADIWGDPGTYIGLLLAWLVLTLMFSLGMAFIDRKNMGQFILSFTVLYWLSVVVYFLSAQSTGKKYLEYAFWALLIGLIIANTVGTPKWLKPALRSEFYVKTGLVLMGTEVIFQNIANFGLYGVVIVALVVPTVILFMWWFGVHVLKMDSKALVITEAVATSVCGVSAAIATGAAAKAKKAELTLAVGISMLFTVLMMIFMPVLVDATNMDPLIGGAWIGNTVDSTGAVALAGAATGSQIAEQAAVMVKMIQNVLIGFISFFVAVFFATKVEPQAEAEATGSTVKRRVGLGEIWDRLPKFVIGFLAVSLFFSFVITPTWGSEFTGEIISSISVIKKWCFCLAFLCIGLETNFKELAEQMEGGKPMTLYLVGQGLSLVLSLAVCWIVLSGQFFPVPDLATLGAA